MSDNAAILEALYSRRREFELEAVALRARVEELGLLIATLEPPRRGRPRKPALDVVTAPDGVPGAAWHTPTDDGDEAV